MFINIILSSSISFSSFSFFNLFFHLSTRNDVHWSLPASSGVLKTVLGELILLSLLLVILLIRLNFQREAIFSEGLHVWARTSIFVCLFQFLFILNFNQFYTSKLPPLDCIYVQIFLQFSVNCWFQLKISIRLSRHFSGRS